MFDRVGAGYVAGEGRDEVLAAGFHFGRYEEVLLEGVRCALLATASSEENADVEGKWLVRCGDALFELRKWREAESYVGKRASSSNTRRGNHTAYSNWILCDKLASRRGSAPHCLCRSEA